MQQIFKKKKKYLHLKGKKKQGDVVTYSNEL